MTEHYNAMIYLLNSSSVGIRTEYHGLTVTIIKTSFLFMLIALQRKANEVLVSSTLIEYTELSRT